MAAQGPTLSSPRGAVDAVGSNIVNRIGNLNLRSVGAGIGEQGGGAGAGAGQAAERPTGQRASTGPGNGMGTGLRSAVI